MISEFFGLFADVNSRFNVIIEESAHLQETIGYLLPADFPLTGKLIEKASTECGLEESQLSLLEEAGFRRNVVFPFENETLYSGSSPRVRAFLSLWNALGAVIVGAVQNQRTLSNSFDKALVRLKSCEAYPSHDSILELEPVYWFLAMRGYFIGSVFDTYTTLIEQAHEKIIQMQENRAGTLPAPILLRRWNSALIGDFISRYVRHVNWETGEIIRRLLTNGEGGAHKQERVSERVTVTHSWAHSSRSAVIPYSLSKSNSERKHTKVTKYGAIRSAYFFLEQPILIPLLYHECAHLHFPTDRESDNAGSRFFYLRREVYKTLRHPSLGDVDTNFWDHFTEEVWSDAVSIALCGRAYVSALISQIFGISGSDHYSHFDLTQDQIFPVNTLANESKRRYPAGYPSEDHNYFWEARFRTALWICERLYQDNATQEQCSVLRELLGIWQNSGKAAFRSDFTSEEHERLWSQRIAFNEWASTTLCDYLHELLPSLKEYSSISDMYLINSEFTEHVIRLTEDFIKLKDDNEQEMVSPPLRLDQVANEVRGRVLLKVTKNILEAGSADERRERIDTWASWKQVDGSYAFRLSLEWCLFRISIIDSIIDFEYRYKNLDAIDAECAAKSGAISSDGLGADPSETSLRAQTLEFIFKELVDRSHWEKAWPSGASTREVWDWLLRKRALFNRYPNGSLVIEDENHTWAMELARNVSKLATDALRVNSGCAQFAASSLSLGVIKPAWHAQFEMVRKGDDAPSPLCDYLNTVRDSIKRSTDLTLLKGKHSSGARQTFLPLLGEYNFASLTSEWMPSLRQVHYENSPPVLVKPRSVVRVYATSESPSYTIGRITLVKFEYRFQWMFLRDRLKSLVDANANVDAEIYLSSAWEDAVLISSCKNDSDFWYGLRNYGLVVDRDHVDTQTAVICTALNDNEKLYPSFVFDGGAWSKEFARWARSNPDIVHCFSDRIGRYDFTVSWKNSADTIGGTATGLLSIPEVFWRSVASFSTTFERESCCTAESQTKSVTIFSLF